MSPQSVAYIRTDMAICLRLLRHWVCIAFCRTREKTGNKIAARMAMIAMTTKSSIRVKPFLPMVNTSQVGHVLRRALPAAGAAVRIAVVLPVVAQNLEVQGPH